MAAGAQSDPVREERFPPSDPGDRAVGPTGLRLSILDRAGSARAPCPGALNRRTWLSASASRRHCIALSVHDQPAPSSTRPLSRPCPHHDCPLHRLVSSRLRPGALAGPGPKVTGASTMVGIEGEVTGPTSEWDSALREGECGDELGRPVGCFVPQFGHLTLGRRLRAGTEEGKQKLHSSDPVREGVVPFHHHGGTSPVRPSTTVNSHSGMAVSKPDIAARRRHFDHGVNGGAWR